MDQEKKLRTIYAHVFPDNSIYIGQTGQEKLYMRWGYGSNYDYNTNMKQAIAYWGWCNVKHEILEQSVMTKEECNKKECDYTMEYVKKGYKVLNTYNAVDPCRYRTKEVKQQYVYVDLSTNKAYESLRKAAKDLDCSYELVRLSVKDGRTIKGTHKFEKRVKEIKIVYEEKEDN